MKRGTRVGQAYVSVTADGDGINEEIVNSVDAAGKDIDKKGDEHGKRYSKRFGETLDELPDKIRKKLDENLDQTIGGSGDRAGRKFGKDFGKALSKSLKNELKDFENRLGRQLDDLKNELGGVSGNRGGGGVTAVGGDDDGRRFLHTLKGNLDIVGTFEKNRVKLRKESNAAIEKSDIDLRKQQEKIYAGAVKDYEKFWADGLKERERTERATQKRIELISKARSKFERDLQAGRVDKRGVDIDRRRGVGGGDVTIGRFLGAGSRSRVLNFFGRSLNNTISLFDTLKDKSAEVFKGFEEGFSSAEEGASFFQKALKGLQGAGGAFGGEGEGILAAIGASGEAIIPTIVALTAALSVFVSVLGGVLAIVLAVSSAIASALVGSLVVAGGLFAAVAGGAGLLTLALLSMTDAQKKAVSTAFQPFIATLNNLGQTILTGLLPAIGSIASNLQSAVALFIPFGEAIGKALGSFGTAFSAALTGPGFRDFAYALGQYLPGILNNLGSAFGGFFNGILGLFTAVMPFVTQFSGYLAGLATRFSNFANSAAGRNKIVDFVSRAVESIKHLFGFLHQLGGLIADVLFSKSAQKAGNQIFDSMADGLKRLRAFIKRAASDGSLEKFFQSGVKFAKSLGKAIIALSKTFVALYNNGTLDSISASLATIANFAEVLTPLVSVLSNAIGALAGSFANLLGPINAGISNLKAFIDTAGQAVRALGSIGFGWGKGVPSSSSVKSVAPGNSLSANAADRMIQLANQRKISTGGGGGIGGGGGGGGGGAATPKPWVNPYLAFANSLIKQGPTVAEQMRKALKALSKEAVKAIRESAAGTDAESVISALADLAKNLRDSAKDAVSTARENLNSAAESLAGVTDPKDLPKALAAVKTAQKDLKQARRNLKRSRRAALIVQGQEVLTQSNVTQLVAGLKVQNATLADFAEARSRVADLISEANDKLTAAIQLRDDYLQQVKDSTSAFGALTTAQAQTINGVEQALTANDITSNLQDRLTKIQKFQSDLRILLAEGLSNVAYKQLVDAGVESGSAFADALVHGGIGSVQQVNNLTAQIEATANALGIEASNRLYQAGVSAAQGLVDGLTSLSAQLNSAAAQLGESIAAALRRSLGIHSPSTVMIESMERVGDGLVTGLSRQQARVESAASELGSYISVRPGGYKTDATGSGWPENYGASGDPRFRDLHVHTPTENPEAVAKEVLNEVTGRL